MIVGQKVNLRLFTEADLSEFLKLTGNLKNRGEYWPVFLHAETKLRKQYAEDGLWGEQFGRMAITDQQNNMLGEIYFFKGPIHTDGYEVAYQIFRPEDRGKGYTTEALRLFVDYLFLLKPINRLQVSIIPGNTASRKVAEKCGFQYEGRLRGVFFVRGKFADLEMFSILRKEWETTYKP